MYFRDSVRLDRSLIRPQPEAYGRISKVVVYDQGVDNYYVSRMILNDMDVNLEMQIENLDVYIAWSDEFIVLSSRATT